GHKAEIGYWLAKPWWGRGIMTAVVGKACEYAFSRWQLVRITAHVFESNIASARVLEKNGFEFERLLRKHHLKDGRFLDSRLFALVRCFFWGGRFLGSLESGVFIPPAIAD